MQVYSGSSNPQLAKKLAAKLKVKLGQMEVTRFANDEGRVFVKEPKVAEKVAIVQSLSIPTDTHLVEFCLLCDALRRKGAKKIIAVIPWLGYSKQDRVFRDGEALSVKVIAKILELNFLDKIITFNLHSSHIKKSFRRPLVELTARPLIEDYFAKKVTKDHVVVAPDIGAVASAKRLAKDLGVGLVKVSKSRSRVTGKVSIHGIEGEIKGKRAIIKDDMIATGSTLVEVSRFLKKKGAKSIEVGAVHHLFVPGAQTKLNQAGIDRLVVTDTVAKPEKEHNNIKILSVAGQIAKAIGS
jgi:ribose-phosphate pyrophosphokinase